MMIASADDATDWALGPGSVTWRVMSDPAVFLIGLLREALLLSLHPPFAAAAVDHDSFGDDPIMRFRRIGVYAYTATYGSKADAERVSAMVRRRHVQITGVEALTLLPYRANSEYELALTQAMLSASFLAVHEVLHGELSGKERDQFLQEQRLPGALLGVTPEHLPATYGELTDVLVHSRQRFATGLQAREILAPFTRSNYPRGTAIGDLPRLRRRAAMIGLRAAADMAIVTMGQEERRLLSIGRRPQLGSDAAARLSLAGLSAYLRSPKGQQSFYDFLGANTAKIIRRALEADSRPGRRARRSSFKVPSADGLVADLSDLSRNWPGSVETYRLGESSSAPARPVAQKAPRTISAS